MMSFPQIDPVAFAIGPIAIRWYSLAYIGGLLLGYLYIRHLIRRSAGQADILDRQPSVDHISDFFVWATIGIILGGRLGYVLFYYPSHFIADPLSVFQVWQGGMSFHGGFLGVVIATLLFCRKYDLHPFKLGDLLACAAPIGLFFGRIANFINGELWGRPTDVSWGMVFPNADQLPRHPSQLYEAALEGFVLFFILFLTIRLFNFLRYPGAQIAIFFIGYGLSRFIVEFFREPDDGIGLFDWISLGQIYSLPMIIAGMGFAFFAFQKSKQRQVG